MTTEKATQPIFSNVEAAARNYHRLPIECREWISLAKNDYLRIGTSNGGGYTAQDLLDKIDHKTRTWLDPKQRKETQRR